MKKKSFSSVILTCRNLTATNATMPVCAASGVRAVARAEMTPDRRNGYLGRIRITIQRDSSRSWRSVNKIDKFTEEERCRQMVSMIIAKNMVDNLTWRPTWRTRRWTGRCLEWFLSAIISRVWSDQFRSLWPSYRSGLIVVNLIHDSKR